MLRYLGGKSFLDLLHDRIGRLAPSRIGKGLAVLMLSAVNAPAVTVVVLAFYSLLFYRRLARWIGGRA